MAAHRTDVDTGRPAERAGAYRPRSRFTETKAGFKTTEFILAIVAIAGILIATYIADANLDDTEGWRFATWVAVAYIVSRGLAKLGSREPYAGDDVT
ncbi:MAG TPA: hypothetical protein VFZ68_12965 [Acidimicrobiales bacterium]